MKIEDELTKRLPSELNFEFRNFADHPLEHFEQF